VPLSRIEPRCCTSIPGVWQYDRAGSTLFVSRGHKLSLRLSLTNFMENTRDRTVCDVSSLHMDCIAARMAVFWNHHDFCCCCFFC
jgi:hypothetical protein